MNSQDHRKEVPDLSNQVLLIQEFLVATVDIHSSKVKSRVVKTEILMAKEERHIVEMVEVTLNIKIEILMEWAGKLITVTLTAEKHMVMATEIQSNSSMTLLEEQISKANMLGKLIRLIKDLQIRGHHRCVQPTSCLVIPIKNGQRDQTSEAAADLGQRKRRRRRIEKVAKARIAPRNSRHLVSRAIKEVNRAVN